jgi:transaldolase/glucose-6-phosphate isomerase
MARTVRSDCHEEASVDVKELHEKYGQSVWLDDMRRHRLQSGDFSRMVQNDGIRGATSNPSIFEKAIAGSTDYGPALERYEKRKDATASAIYEHLAIQDIQQAADLLRPVYEQSERRDGYVSMEVSPYLAHDTQATLDEATRLWRTVRRDNLMIKIPATPEGVPVIRTLIGQGINVNATLLFSRAVCRQVAEAYMDGLDAWSAAGGDFTRVASVASLFVSRLDVLVDPMLEAGATAMSGARQGPLPNLVGKVAIANAKLAYQDWKDMCQSPRWQALAARGARSQRLLWAGTSTKDPRWSDVVYVESLKGLPNRSASHRCFSAYGVSAGDTRRSPTSAWCPPRSWGSTCRGSSTVRRSWCTRARRACRPSKTREFCSA